MKKALLRRSRAVSEFSVVVACHWLLPPLHKWYAGVYM